MLEGYLADGPGLGPLTGAGVPQNLHNALLAELVRVNDLRTLRERDREFAVRNPGIGGKVFHIECIFQDPGRIAGFDPGDKP